MVHFMLKINQKHVFYFKPATEQESSIFHQLINNAVEEIIKNEVIAWVQGKMEFGARALGNRSFLADPRNENIIEKRFLV